MEGVKEVVQLDAKRLRWRAEIGGNDEGGRDHRSGPRPPHRVARRHRRHEPRDAGEKVGDALGFLERRVDGDLERFKHFIESRGAATGAWRGVIHGERVDP